MLWSVYVLFFYGKMIIFVFYEFTGNLMLEFYLEGLFFIFNFSINKY